MRRVGSGKVSRQGVPQGGVISPLVAHWRQTGKGEAWDARIINYADDFVVLSRGHAAEAWAWTDIVMRRLGSILNRMQSWLCDARWEGYSFGPNCHRQQGRWFTGAS